MNLRLSRCALVHILIVGEFTWLDWYQSCLFLVPIKGVIETVLVILGDIK